jgi:hypothetical protein
MDVIHSVAIVHWRLVYNSAEAFICTDDIQSPIHVLLYEQNQRRSCPHNCTTTPKPMLAPATLPYCQLSCNTEQARASCIKVVRKKEQPLLALQHSQSEGQHHHPLRDKTIKGKAHVQIHGGTYIKGCRGIAQLQQYPQNICGPYFVRSLRWTKAHSPGTMLAVNGRQPQLFD